MPDSAPRELRTTAVFLPHPSLDDSINDDICQSEIEGGVFLDKLPIGAVIEVETTNRSYQIEHVGGGQGLITGHPKFCPCPVLVELHGSTWGRAMMKMDFIGRGMFLEFRHPVYGVIRTSRIREIREVKANPPA